jgi:hypothetical protein
MGQEIPLERMELELSEAAPGAMAVYASARMQAKVTGLAPGKQGIEVFLEWEGATYRVVEATIFDVDVHISGESTVQLTGRLEPWGPHPPAAP